MSRNERTRELINCTIDLLKDKKHWIKGSYAKKHRRGWGIPSFSPEATCFCMQGALDRCTTGVVNYDGFYTPPTPKLEPEVRRDKERAKVAIQTAIHQLHPRLGAYIERFNDRKGTTHKHVMAVLEAARDIVAEMNEADTND